MAAERSRRNESGPAFGSVPKSLSVRSVIELCPLLSELPEPRKQVLECSSYLSFAQRGEVLFEADTPRRFEIVVGEGRIDFLDSEDQVVDVLEAGNCSIRLLSLEGGSQTRTATAGCATWYLKIPRRLLNEMYICEPGFRAAVVQQLPASCRCPWAQD